MVATGKSQNKMWSLFALELWEVFFSNLLVYYPQSDWEMNIYGQYSISEIINLPHVSLHVPGYDWGSSVTFSRLYASVCSTCCCGALWVKRQSLHPSFIHLSSVWSCSCSISGRQCGDLWRAFIRPFLLSISFLIKGSILFILRLPVQGVF